MAVTVKVKNFQSIKDASLVIDGLTLLTGSNNSGKTALMRAMQGVFENTRGHRFVRHGADKCSVALEFDDGRSVRWEKGPKIKPAYYLDGSKKAIHPGQGVPDEVKALGVVPITAGSREQWPQVASQFTGQVFLLDEPGSVLAEAVANVDRVGRLNRALKSSEKDQRSVRVELKVRLEDQTKYEEQVAAFDGLDEVLAEVAAIEEAQAQVDRMERAIEKLSELLGRFNKALAVAKRLEGIENIKVPESDAEDLYDELRGLLALQRRTLAAHVKAERWGGGFVLPNLDSTEAEKLATALVKVNDLQERWQSAETRRKRNAAEVESLEAELVEAEQTVQDELAALGECPTCGATVGEQE